MDAVLYHLLSHVLFLDLSLVLSLHAYLRCHHEAAYWTVSQSLWASGPSLFSMKNAGQESDPLRPLDDLMAIRRKN
jgi:hypothetical protein